MKQTCPSCGKPIPPKADKCPECGALLKRSKNSPSGGEFNILYYAISFILPPVGLVIGIINLFHQDIYQKYTGQLLIVFSFLSVVIIFILVCLTFSF